MRILITNDDGIDAPGLAVLENIAKQLSDDVWVVAPSKNQSGVGHKFTLATELSLDQRDKRKFAIDGTPADCAAIGMTHVLKDKPADVILSGVNRGQNIADVIHCSGTVAGAREGALQGAIGIALSQSMDFSKEHLIDWDVSERFGAEAVRTVLDNHTGEDIYYNINFPRCTPDQVTGIEAVPHQRFSQSAFEYYPSDNEGHFFVTILKTPQPLDKNADCVWLLDHNAITVTPLELQQSSARAIDRLNGKLKLG
jgi:5'-nucleotidase